MLVAIFAQFFFGQWYIYFMKTYAAVIFIASLLSISVCGFLTFFKLNDAQEVINEEDQKMQ
jgi:hypothetical protein